MPTHDITVDYSTDPPTVHMADLPPDTQIVGVFATATASVTHADGGVCDDECEAHNHYRSEES